MACRINWNENFNSKKGIVIDISEKETYEQVKDYIVSLMTVGIDE